MGFRPSAPSIEVIGSAFGFPPLAMVGAKSYGTPFVEFGALTNQTGGLLSCTPIWVPRSLSVDALEIEVTTGAATSNFRMGIYEDTGLGFPGALVAGSEVSVATTAAGIQTGVIAAALTQGLYWLAGVRQGTGNPTMVGIAGYTGVVGTSGALRISGGMGAGWRDGVGNHAGALPNPFPSGAGTIQDNAPSFPRIMMRVV